MRTLLVFLSCSFVLGNTFTQEALSRHQLRLNVGLGYEDGLRLPKPLIPALGVGYDYNVSKLLTLSFNVLTYYRSVNDPDPYEEFFSDILIGTLRPGVSPLAGIGVEEALTENGWRPLNTRNTIKAFYLPVDIGLTLNLLNSKRHLVGFNAGLAIVYASYNFLRNYYSVDQIFLENRSVINEPTIISLGSDFHSITANFSMKLLYAYKFSDNFSLGARFANYHVISDSSIFFLFRI